MFCVQGNWSILRIDHCLQRNSVTMLHSALYSYTPAVSVSYSYSPFCDVPIFAPIASLSSAFFSTGFGGGGTFGHGFSRASCIMTTQPFGPDTAPMRTDQHQLVTIETQSAEQIETINSPFTKTIPFSSSVCSTFKFCTVFLCPPIFPAIFFPG